LGSLQECPTSSRCRTGCDAIAVLGGGSHCTDHEVKRLGAFGGVQGGIRRGSYLADANEDRGPWVEAHANERIGRAHTPGSRASPVGKWAY